MKKVKLDEAMRFFDDRKLAKEAKLTEEEFKVLDELEWVFLNNWGLRQRNLGFTKITIYAIGEDEEKDILYCKLECGVEGDYCEEREALFNRKTLELDLIKL